MTTELSRRNPYPGPRPFERGEQNLFFGRDREVSDLLSLMIAHREVLLYAQSGAGKTSLLNAGVVPLLIQEGFEVLPVARVRGLIPEGLDLKEVGNVYAFNTTMAWEADKVDPRSMTSISLAAFLRGRGRPTDEQGLPLPWVAIFDQFEELFAFYAERWREREGFFLQVTEALEADPLLRVLFVIREDYLASLAPYADLLPEGLRTRYRLERLRTEAACLAVESPLRGTGRSFDEGVASSLVQQLAGIQLESTTGEVIEAEGEYVEPVQLQVVCQNLWLELPPETTVITADHLRTFGGVNEALKAFYEKAIRRVAGETGVKEGDLRRWFDHQLITTAGTRGTVFHGRDSTGGIPNAAVDALENQHLIRAELRAGARWYELTHDRFINPIQRSNETWRQNERAEEQQLQLEAERQRAAEQQRRAEEQARIARRLQRLSAALVIASVLTVGAAGLAVWGWKAADAERDRAEQHARVAATRAVEAEKARAESVDAQKLAEGERQRAEQKARLATARELAAAAIDNLNRDPERSILLALQAVSETYAVDKTAASEAEDALHRAVQASRVQLTLSGHSDKLFGVAFSPNGTLLATASGDRTVKMWDAATGQELQTLAGHANAVRGVAFSPEGARLATASVDRMAKVWDAGSGELLLTLPDHTDELWSVAFSPDGQRLATTSSDKTAKVWDLATGEILLTLSGHTEAVLSVAFSPDGKHLATTSLDSTVKIWEVASGQELRTISEHLGEVDGVAFSPDGTRMATAGSADKVVKVWDANSGQKLLTLSGHDNGIISIAFSPDGVRLATASADGTARVWDAITGKELLTLGHTERLFGIAFSPDGTRLATTSWDKTAKVWDITPGHEVLTLSSHESLWGGIPFSPDGTRLALSNEGTVTVWDVATSQEVLTVSGGHTAPVSAAAFSPDGIRLATASMNGTVKMWDAVTGQALGTLPGHTDMVFGMAFSLDGARLATASRDRTARVWDAATGEVLLTLSGHRDAVFQIAFSPDGARLATASRDGTARVWDAASGREMFKLSDHSGMVIGIAYSPDGTRLATAGFDHTARVRDAATGKVLLTLSSHTDTVQGVTYNPDGTRLATASWDRTAKVWDARTGKVLLTLSGHTTTVTAVAFSPDERHLATASADGTIRVHVLKIDDLMALARSRLTRSWTSTECQRYLHQDQCPPTVMALWLIAEGHNRARVGDLNGAVASLQRARELDPAVVFDPEAEARALTVARLIAKGKNRAQAGDIDGAAESFRKAHDHNPAAMVLDPEAAARRWAGSALIERGGQLVKQGKAKEALALYKAAQEVDPALRISAGSWNVLCWFGGLRGYAAAVMAACEQAVALFPEHGNFRDSRGLARALIGDYVGAVEDFKFYVEWSQQYVSLKVTRFKRQAWVAELEAGQNPFDSATLEVLRLNPFFNN